MISLVTGAAGFLGHHLVRALVDAGEEVIATDYRRQWTGGEPPEGVQVHHADLLDPENVNSLRHVVRESGVDVCYHLAARARVAPSFDDGAPLTYAAANVLGTLAVLELAREYRQFRVVFAGSSTCDGDPQANPYALTKHQAEQWVMVYARRFGVSAAIARIYNAYGEHLPTDPKYGLLLGIWEAALRDGLPFTIYGNGLAERDFTHVGDVCQRLIYLGRERYVGLGPHGIGNGEPYSIRRVAQLFARGDDGRIRYEPARSGEMHRTCSSRHGWYNLLPQPKQLPDYIAALHEKYSQPEEPPDVAERDEA